MSKPCIATLIGVFASSALLAQQPVRPLPTAPRAAATLQAQSSATAPNANAAPTDAVEPLTRQQAEQMALKNNPRISVQRLLALAEAQVVRETRSAELPSLYGNGTGVGAVQGSRLGSGSLAASRLLNHVGAGLELNQLITDFGHTRNLVASSSLHAKAEDQTSEATREDIVLAADMAFYNALEAQATLQVAQSTVSARQNVNQQVSALTASKLKSTLDQSFAQVNLSQAQLLSLDSENQVNAAMATLNDVLGTTSDRHYHLLDDSTPAAPVAASADAVIALAMQQRPDLKAMQLTHEADVRYSRAEHDQLLPTINAQGVVGETPVGADVGATNYFTPAWYGAGGVNISIPIFNGFKFHAEADEADLRAKASDEHTRQLVDQIVRDVRTAWLMAVTAKQRMSVTHDLLQQANTALDLAQTRYQLGLSSIVELSQAQLEQTQAQIAEANARFEYEADLATLRFQSGSRP
jgi:outer membrane protein